MFDAQCDFAAVVYGPNGYPDRLLLDFAEDPYATTMPTRPPTPGFAGRTNLRRFTGCWVLRCWVRWRRRRAGAIFNATVYGRAPSA
jgi:hypothetical protein